MLVVAAVVAVAMAVAIGGIVISLSFVSVLSLLLSLAAPPTGHWQLWLLVALAPFCYCRTASPVRVVDGAAHAVIDVGRRRRLHRNPLSAAVHVQ